MSSSSIGHLLFAYHANISNLFFLVFLVVAFLEKVEDHMADKWSAPRFNSATIQAKRKKMKGIKVLSGDGATDFEGSSGLAQNVTSPSGLPKRQCVDNGLATDETGRSAAHILDSPGIPEVALPLIGSSAHPLPLLDLVSYNNLNPC